MAEKFWKSMEKNEKNIPAQQDWKERALLVLEAWLLTQKLRFFGLWKYIPVIFLTSIEKSFPPKASDLQCV